MPIYVNIKISEELKGDLSSDKNDFIKSWQSCSSLLQFRIHDEITHKKKSHISHKQATPPLILWQSFDSFIEIWSILPEDHFNSYTVTLYIISLVL